VEKSNEADLEKHSELLTIKLLNCLDFNPKNSLLSIPDANMTYDQLCLLLSALGSLGRLGQTSKDQKLEQFEVSGLNLNGNQDLEDGAMKKLTRFAVDNPNIRVLSVERFQLTHVSLLHLFSSLPRTNLFELNLSGIPLSYPCIEQMCKMLDSPKTKLQVLHLRNTKLNDLSALKLMECIVGIEVNNPLPIRYLSLSMNNKLGFHFQNGLLKML
jgi:hypothetical protein